MDEKKKMLRTVHRRGNEVGIRVYHADTISPMSTRAGVGGDSDSQGHEIPGTRIARGGGALTLQLQLLQRAPTRASLPRNRKVMPHTLLNLRWLLYR